MIIKEREKSSNEWKNLVEVVESFYAAKEKKIGNPGTSRDNQFSRQESIKPKKAAG